MSNTNNILPQTNSEKNNVMNAKLYERNVPSQPLRSFLDVRPQNTKYTTVMPVVDNVNTASIKQPVMHNAIGTFNPGTYAPWYGYAANIDKETDLHNSKMSQRGTFGASSASDMYKFTWSNNNDPNSKVPQPFVNLFKTEKFNKTVVPNAVEENAGNFFNESTRHNIRSMNDDKIYK